MHPKPAKVPGVIIYPDANFRQADLSWFYCPQPILFYWDMCWTFMLWLGLVCNPTLWRVNNQSGRPAGLSL
ncbi:BTB/POZ domain-containing protein KCTD9 [Edwardsiella piscicida]|nr:BTB/POZ domain-containing protein KCTD9 [Edwardsiella piscicida]GAJ68599.1 BTB/POZ domain-containing protein KCTD9 [Edwardsiella piscicida]